MSDGGAAGAVQAIFAVLEEAGGPGPRPMRWLQPSAGRCVLVGYVSGVNSKGCGSNGQCKVALLLTLPLLHPLPADSFPLLADFNLTELLAPFASSVAALDRVCPTLVDSILWVRGQLVEGGRGHEEAMPCFLAAPRLEAMPCL